MAEPPIPPTQRTPATPQRAPAIAGDPPESPWRTTGAREVYRNPWLRVTEYGVIRPDGQPGIYGVVDPGDNVTVVALEADQRVWLVGEFRYPTQRFDWMVPSGKIEPGEAPEAAARRELAEETGLRAAAWTLLGTYELSNGISPQTSYLYLARELRLGEARPERTEQFQFRQLPLEEVYAHCQNGAIRDAPSALAIWRARAHLRGELDR